MVVQNSLQQTLNWYVAYTYPQAEKKVDRMLCERGIISFLPLQKVIRQWSDRKKKLEVPLFPNYIFLQATEIQRFEALNIKELVRYVSFEGRPTILNQKDIENIRLINKKQVAVEVEPIDHFKLGMKIRIIVGQLKGLEGLLIRKNGHQRLLIQIEALGQAVSVEIPAAYTQIIR